MRSATQMFTFPPKSASLGRNALRLMYASAALLGFAWYYFAAGTGSSFSPVDLGLTYLRIAVLGLFLGVCVARGFTIWRAVLLAVPFAVTTFLDMKLTAFQLSDGLTTRPDELRLLVVIAVSYLAATLAWVVAFPVPLLWQTVPPDPRALWRRLEWTGAAVVGAILALSAFYMISLTYSSLDLQTVLSEIKKAAARGIQRDALYIYLLGFFRVALRLELAERYKQGTPSPTQ